MPAFCSSAAVSMLMFSRLLAARDIVACRITGTSRP